MLIQSRTKTDKLTRRVEDFYDDKEREERFKEEQEANIKLIRQAPQITKMEFWCPKHGDTTGLAFKVVFNDLRQLKAYYESFNSRFPSQLLACCGHLRRRITDKQFDPYFKDSEMIRKQQNEAKEKGWLLQPKDEGFVTKYGDPNKKKYAQLEKQERETYERNHQ